MATDSSFFLRTKIRARRSTFLRKNWSPLAVIVAGAVAGAIVLALLFPGVEIPLWVAVPTAVLMMLLFAQELFDGTYHLQTALDAERWTSKDLRRLLGSEWKVLNGILFDHFDVDHVVIGRGGVYAVETKYTDELDLSSAKNADRITQWISHADKGARSVRSLLRSFGYVMDVRPMIVVWGSEVRGEFIASDVPVMRPRQLEAQIRTWTSPPQLLAQQDVTLISDRIAEYQKMRLSFEQLSGSD